MDIEEIQDVTEEMFEKEEKKIAKDEKPRTRSKSRSRFHSLPHYTIEIRVFG